MSEEFNSQFHRQTDKDQDAENDDVLPLIALLAIAAFIYLIAASVAS